MFGLKERVAKLEVRSDDDRSYIREHRNELIDLKSEIKALRACINGTHSYEIGTTLIAGKGDFKVCKDCGKEVKIKEVEDDNTK